MSLLDNYRDKLRSFDVKKIFPQVTALLISIIFSLILMEIFLSKINFPYHKCENIKDVSETYLGTFDPDTGWSYKRQISYYDYYEKYQYHFNEKGYRIPSPNYKTDYSKPRIVFIGGSVTFGEQLPYELTYASQIGKLLGDRYEIVNLGVQGYGTAQSLLRLKSLIDDIDPEYIVYTFIPDHINRNVTYDRRVHAVCAEFQGTSPIFSLKNDKLYLKKKPKKFSEIDRYKLSLLINMSFQRLVQEKLVNSGKAQEITREIIREISNVSDKHNAKDYYIYFDTSYNTNSDNWNSKTIDFLFKEQGENDVLPFINWASDSFPAGTKYYIYDQDNLHPNASLSAEIAKQFVAKFEKDFNQ